VKREKEKEIILIRERIERDYEWDKFYDMIYCSYFL